MNKFTKKYQLWITTDSGYTPIEFDDLNELPDLIAQNCYGRADYYTTQNINYEVKEK